jgi:hypothetical protein
MTEPRSAKPTVKFVDDYCQWYQPIFPEVRSFEAFKNLHIGMLADIKRKSLPAIARAAGLDQEQSLHYFITVSPWQVWWEVLMSAYLLVSLHSTSLYTKSDFQEDNKLSVVVKTFSRHAWWDEGTGWKNLLNNLRLVLQPFVLLNLIRPRLVSFSNSGFIFGIFTTDCAYELLSWCSSHSSSKA